MRLIDADAMFDRIYNGPATEMQKSFLSVCLGTEPTAASVVMAPAISAVWELHVEPDRENEYYECSNCGFIWRDGYAVRNYFKGCPNCRAMMKPEI